MKKQNGFCFIEILIALSIFAFVITGLTEMMLLALHSSRQSLYETIAVNRLSDMMVILKNDPDHFRLYENTWQDDVKRDLPKGEGEAEVFPFGNVLRVIWLSGKFSTWRCDIPKQKDHSCLSLRVVKA